ncbi:CBM96 family carbohydrate-binding protein [Polaribacter sp.]|uniref:CBM96 family carbohydrate-binding protein n=1 Tax=Polaribacter sp. TaxID=1920175 RepID=UPI003EF67AC3
MKNKIIKNKNLTQFWILTLLLLHTAIFSQTVIETYADGDTQNSIKNDFSISVDGSYQLDLSLENATDATYLTLSQNGTGYDVVLQSRDTEESHHISIIGSIKDLNGNEVKTYSEKFTVQQATPSSSESSASWMSGKWGVRFAIQGGTKLDAAVAAGANYYNGIKQIADTLKTVGYVISNLTNNAHGYHFTLRDHPYIDIANEIHPDFVPSKENEQITLDVLKAIKDSGKKVILYIASDGPSASGGTPNNAEYKAAWEAYYNENFNGEEATAWKHLVKGFVERFNDLGLVDGFWVDHAVALPGGPSNFVNMLREVNPDFAITVNYGKKYFDKTVASNGIDMPTNHKVVNLWPTGGDYNDFTAGHPTPLATGAAPNSWAYEELTLEETKNAPWVALNDKKILRHFWTPVRQNWTSPNSDNFPVLFDTEQAYRFVRTLTDAGAAHSFANTISLGSITQEEFEMFKVIDARMQQAQKPDYEPYTRPIGAYFKQEYRFDGSFNTNYWDNAANWSSGQLPSSTSDVVIKAGDSILVASDSSVRDLLIEEGASLNVSKEINFQIYGNVRGTINYLESIAPAPVPGIVSQYLFENNLNDEIGDNHGTLVGEPTFVNSGVKEGDYSLLLDGDNDQIDLINHVEDFPKGGAARTITGWFNTTSTTGSIFNYGTEATGERFEIIGNLNEFSVAVSGFKWGVDNLSLSSDWHHFAVVLPSIADPQSDDLLLYLDGELITAARLAGAVRSINTGDSFAVIGAAYNGTLDDFRIYNTALDASEIYTVIHGPILVSSLSFEDDLVVYENNSIQMTVSVLPEDTADKSVSWSVANGSGSATIDDNGLLTGTAIGTVTVTATAKDGSEVTSQTEVTVSAINPVTSITVQGIGGITTIEVGTELQMEAFILPEDASIKNVVWSLDPVGGLGTIDENGVFVGDNDGAVTIYATATDNSGISGVVSIQVVTHPLVQSIDVYGLNGVNAIQLGTTFPMKVSVLPADADDASVTWSVIDGTGSASITTEGYLTGNALGTVTVKATAVDGSAVYGQLEMTVQEDAIDTDVTIYLTEDAYTWDRFATKNYGGVKLIVRDDPADLNRHSYVKFDLSMLSDVETAKFRLTLDEATEDTRSFEAFLVDDSWTENTITWNNAPTNGVSLGVVSNSGQLIEWDVTSTVLSQMQENEWLSIKVISKDMEITNGIYSKEVAVTDIDKPRIVITSTGETLSINDAINTSNLSVYPNPTTGKVNIQGLKNEDTTIYIYNNLGQLLQHEKYNSNINMSSFKAGIYFMKILSAHEQKTIRIIKK